MQTSHRLPADWPHLVGVALQDGYGDELSTLELSQRHLADLAPAAELQRQLQRPR